ncbi:hypothetical protein BHE74_00003572 [Ensete ventricosum]|nr:hypothetical protein GW17_00033215 [Ensete ventricosum]RWW87591.1 hypothetical protein BHE74_00003572 [Ensete ventricosum]RZR89827.1 hypothetical protein BHM03_00017620 [Ensete ventricosum]
MWQLPLPADSCPAKGQPPHDRCRSRERHLDGRRPCRRCPCLRPHLRATVLTGGALPVGYLPTSVAPAAGHPLRASRGRPSREGGEYEVMAKATAYQP